MTNKAYLDEKLSELEGHVSYIEKDYIQFKLLSDKQSMEEVPNQRAVQTTIQIVCDKELFDNFPNADNVLNVFLIVVRR